MKRLWLLILPVAAGFIWFHFNSVNSSSVQEKTSEAIQPQDPSAPVGAPKAIATNPSTPLAAPAVPVADAWNGISAGVKKLASEDQQGLDDLYADAARLIHSQEKALDAYLAHSMPAIVGASLEESFFTFSAWTRNASAPAAALEHLWEYTPPVDPPSADHHHAAFTQAFRYDSIQAYALSELRKRFAKDGINLSADERASLVKSLIARAANEKSINQSLELLQTLMVLGEKKAVMDSLSTRSERDRKLLAETMGLSTES